MTARPPIHTFTSTLFPYPTLSRSQVPGNRQFGGSGVLVACLRLAQAAPAPDKGVFRPKRGSPHPGTVFDRDAQAWKQLQVVAGGNGDPGTAPGGSPEKVVLDADSERLNS